MHRRPANVQITVHLLHSARHSFNDTRSLAKRRDRPRKSSSLYPSPLFLIPIEIEHRPRRDSRMRVDRCVFPCVRNETTLMVRTSINSTRMVVVASFPWKMARLISRDYGKPYPFAEDQEFPAVQISTETSPQISDIGISRPIDSCLMDARARAHARTPAPPVIRIRGGK